MRRKTAGGRREPGLPNLLSIPADRSALFAAVLKPRLTATKKCRPEKIKNMVFNGDAGEMSYCPP